MFDANFAVGLEFVAVYDGVVDRFGHGNQDVSVGCFVKAIGFPEVVDQPFDPCDVLGFGRKSEFLHGGEHGVRS
jgi:hypothetical protein